MPTKLMRRAALAILALGIIVWPGTAFAQGENPITWTLAEGPKQVKPAQKFDLELTAKIEEGWYLYSTTQPPGGPNATRITMPAGGPFSFYGAPGGPPPKVKYDANFSMETETHDGSVTFALPVEVAKDTASGTHKAEVHVRFQTCNERLCLPPKTEKLSVTLNVVGGAPPATQSAAPNAGTPAATSAATSSAAPATTGAVQPAPPAAAPTPTTVAQTPAPQPAAVPVAAPADGDLWSFIWLAMSVGALSLLTPCVFPMVPITVSYFTNHAAGSRKSAVGNACRLLGRHHPDLHCARHAAGARRRCVRLEPLRGEPVGQPADRGHLPRVCDESLRRLRADAALVFAHEARRVHAPRGWQPLHRDAPDGAHVHA